MNYLNLDKKKVGKVLDELNILLSDYHLYYQKLRNFHWNVNGVNFFDLHQLFEDLYVDARVKIDDIAERILTLDGRPLSNLSNYLEKSSIKEVDGTITDKEMVKEIIKDHAAIISQMRKTIGVASKAGDEGTIDLIGAYIRELEKKSWMLNSWTKSKSSMIEK